MPFTARSIAAADLENCFSYLREGFAFQPVHRPKLLALWKELIRNGSWITVAVEDRRLPRGERVVGFGISVFATDDFAARALHGLPFLSRSFLEQWDKGERPYLLKQEVAKANAGEGLNLMVLHYGWDPRLSMDDLQKVQHRQTESFLQQHAGYKTKEYLHEVFGPLLLNFVLNAGCSLRHDYEGKKWRPLLAKVGKDDRPYLTGFRPNEASGQAGTTVSMFQSRDLPPRFRFSPSEQEMLEQALEGRTDEELAASLGLSYWTVKKRWQSVYLKVQKADPDLLGAPRSVKRADGSRSRQRRRYLLDYLRSHLEELRPRVS